jgi:hypothetical protein
MVIVGIVLFLAFYEAPKRKITKGENNGKVTQSSHTNGQSNEGPGAKADADRSISL